MLYVKITSKLILNIPYSAIVYIQRNGLDTEAKMHALTTE